MFAIRITSLCLAALLVPQTVPVAAAQQEPEPQSAPQQSASPQSGSQQQPMQSPPALPSMPVQAQLQQSEAQDASWASQAALPSAPDPQTPTPSQQQAPQQPPALPQQPVGTAAAPAENPTGVPGSRPSGAAIAPAKQKRVRAFVISIGIALAAGAAIGTVVGLSKASHSTP